jgi:hypothetical protein
MEPDGALAITFEEDLPRFSRYPQAAAASYVDASSMAGSDSYR